jgi:hypothetical protein
MATIICAMRCCVRPRSESGAVFSVPTFFHGHDWQAGLLPVYLKNNLAGDPTFFGTKTVFTIHNLGYQGTFDKHKFGDLGLDWSVFHSEGLEFWDQINLLKAGIVYSDSVTTVSPTYAREIQTPEFGFSLDPLLRSRSYKLTGISERHRLQRVDIRKPIRTCRALFVKDLSGKGRVQASAARSFQLAAGYGSAAAGHRLALRRSERVRHFRGHLRWLASRTSHGRARFGEARFEEMFNAFSPACIRIDSVCTSVTTTHWRIASRPAVTCSSCRRVMNPAA